MLMFIYIIIAICLIHYYFNKSNNKPQYCNKYGICIKLTENNKLEFDLVKTELLNLYFKLVEVMNAKDIRTTRLRKKFNINNIFEVYPNNIDNDTSYSINKGEELGVCIRSGSDFYKIHDVDIIKFVFIHELAHIITVTEQHTDEFWHNFKYLLKICYNNNLLKKIDFSKKKYEYCSMSINYNPFFDDNI